MAIASLALATLANASNTSRGTTRNAIARAVGIRLLKETEQGLALPRVGNRTQKGQRPPRTFTALPAGNC